MTDYIIRTENIASSLREAGEIISDGSLIAMVLKGLPYNFKPFTMVITQKDGNLTFTEIKVRLCSYEETEAMYSKVPGHKILQMKNPI